MGGEETTTSDLPVELRVPQEDILFYYNAALGFLRPASSDFGPEITFGRTVADANPSETNCLIKYSSSGKSLAVDWYPITGSIHRAFTNAVYNGLAALTATGHTYEIAGMLWTQGERDAALNRTTEQYTADLTYFIADMRARYGANLPFFLSRLSTNQTYYTPTQLNNIRTAQENVSTADPLTWMIDTDTFPVHWDMWIHFDSQGTMMLGEAFAESYLNR
jgi:hypothetical protein